MVAKMTHRSAPHDPGVVCVYCRNRIALGLVSQAEDSIGEPIGHVILAWCRVCEREAPYQPSEVIDLSQTA
jgi:hypothetical protein